MRMNDEPTVRETASMAWRKGFWSLIATQFQGAFNDNALKYLVIFLIIGTNLSPQEEESKVLLVGTLFALPFILFSMTGGYFADRFSKRSVTIWTKVFEIAVMLFAILGFAMHSLRMSMAAVFLASTQGALFGPSKYGLLPEILPEKRLSWGNGVIELGTFWAAISGTVAGARLSEAFPGRQQISGIIFLGCSVLGLLASFGISKVPAADPAKKFRVNFLGDLWSQSSLILKDQTLYLAVAGNTYFFFLGALLQFDIVFYARDVLQESATRGSFLQAAIAIGIGLGSLAAGYLSGGKIEYGLIPLGALGITIFGFWLAVPGLSFAAVLMLLTALGFFGGFFIVPIGALLQHRPEEQHRGGVLAAANLLSFVGIFAASGVFYLTKHYLHLGPAGIFFWASCLTLAALVYIVWLLPDSLLRLVLWIAAHTLYRLDLKGNENVPARGGALLTPNHSSWIDAVLLAISTDRPVRFLMFKGVYDKPFVKPFAKNAENHSHCQRPGPARDDSFLARSVGSAAQWRSGVHFSGRGNHAHRADAAVSPGLRAHHKRHRRADYSGKYGRNLGLDFQFFRRALFVEVAEAHSLSGAHYLRPADACDLDCGGSPASRAGSWGGRIFPAQEIYAYPESLVREIGATASPALRYGGRANCQALVP
jgi:acyl-[acyl-carrier-protein]-phospholipid O-acyltransferase/long-chain-fatty-acid--[acyl-carrier-protein] ligase